MKMTMNQMEIISFEVSGSSRNNWSNVSHDIRLVLLLPTCRFARLLLSGWKLGCKENKMSADGKGQTKSEEILRYGAKKGHKGRKGHRGRRGTCAYGLALPPDGLGATLTG